MPKNNDNIRDQLIDKAIHSTVGDVPSDGDVEEALSRIGRMMGDAAFTDAQKPTRKSFFRRNAARLAWAAAASIAVAMISTWSFERSHPPPAATYAAAVNAVKTASSLHIKYYTRRGAAENKSLTLVSDTRYSDKGVVRTDYHRDPNPREWADCRIGTIESQWEVYPARKLAVRRAAVHRPEYVLEEVSRNLLLEHIDRAERVESGDETINGVPCRLYVALPHAATTQPTRSPAELEREYGKVFLWTDDRGAVHKCERRSLKDGKWVARTRAEVQYDVAMDPQLLATEFPDDYKVVDLDAELERMFDLDEADMIREVNGMIVAFHNTQPVDERTALTTVTIRPTEKNQRRLMAQYSDAKGYDGYAPGEFTFWSDVRQLAELEDRWLHVKWVAIRSSADNVTEPLTIDFDFVVYVRAQTLLEDSDLKQSSGEKNDTLTVPNRSPMTPAEFADKAYSSIEHLVAYYPKILYMEGDRPGGPRRAARKGFELQVSRESFRQAVIESSQQW